MSDPKLRAHEIVEELRADIDFEIDDVISQIVIGLPEDYFRILSHADQMKHLKALLALGVCNVDQEVMMQSDEGRFIAVVARKNYPGLLAKILQRLPNQQEIVAAKIFTSKEQDFIIDLFEFKSDGNNKSDDPVGHIAIEQKISAVARSTGMPMTQVEHFALQYEPDSPVFDDENDLACQFTAFKNVLALGELSVQLRKHSKNSEQLTIASGSAKAFEVFQKTAGYLAEKSCDIEQAVLNDFASPMGKRVSIASFKLPVNAGLAHQDFISELSKLLQNGTHN